MSAEFYIQWQDHDHDHIGDLDGRHDTASGWQPLPSLSITHTTYHFHFSADTDAHYDTYVTLYEGSPGSTPSIWTHGAKVPIGHNTSMPSVSVGSRATNLVVRAWRLVSEDPKVRVNWSDGNQSQPNGASVELDWQGSAAGWRYQVNGGGYQPLTSLPGKTVDVELALGDNVTISVTDSSSTDNVGAIYDVGPSGTAMTSKDIHTKSLDTATATLREGFSWLFTHETYFAVNLFQTLDDQNTGNLPVS